MRATYTFRGREIVAEADSLSALGDEIGRKIGAILVIDGDVKRATENVTEDTRESSL